MDRHTDVFFTDEDIARYTAGRNILGSSTTDIESFNISNATTFYILPSADQYKRLREEEEERNELERSRSEGSEPCISLPYVHDDSATTNREADTATKLCNGMHHDEDAEKTDSIANQKTDNTTNNDKDEDQGYEVLPPNQSEPLLEAQTEEQKSESLLETEKSETLLDSSPEELDRMGKQLIETENGQSESSSGIEKEKRIDDQKDENKKQSEPITEAEKQSGSTLQSEVDKQVQSEPLAETETKQSEPLLGEKETDEPEETEKQPAEQSIDKEKNKKLIKLGEDNKGSDELINTSDEMNDSPNKDGKISCIRKVKQSSDTNSDDQSEAKHDDICAQPHKTTVKDNDLDSESEEEDEESDELISSDDSPNLKKNKRGHSSITSIKQRRPQNKKAMEPASSDADESEIEEANISSQSREASINRKRSCSDLYSDQSEDEASLSDELISSSDDESDLKVSERRNTQVSFKREVKLPTKTTEPSKPRGRSPIKAKSDDSGWITRQTEIEASQTRINHNRQKSLTTKRRRITTYAAADSPESIGGGDLKYRRSMLRFAAAPVANNNKKKQVSLTTMFAKAKKK